MFTKSKSYTFLYRDPPLPALLAFVVESATDPGHAEEQLLDAEPNAEVVWLTNGTDPDFAFDEYYGEFDDENE